MGNLTDNWFSNFLPCEKPILHEGIQYRTVEHYYQALKTTDINTRKKIAALDSPGKAKKMGQKVVLRENWDQLKVMIMLNGLSQKFAKGTRHHKWLIETGSEDIVEWNYWHDNFWGHCICPKCKDKDKSNMLGKLLMQIRKYG